MKIIEDKIIETPRPTLIGFKCDFCGTEIRDPRDYPHDGFAFVYRSGEEDQVIVEARDMCDECYYDADMREQIVKVIEALKELAPYAQIDAPLWEA